MTENLPDQDRDQVVRPGNNPFSHAAEAEEERRSVVDNSETAMDRLRRPFDVGQTDTSG